MRVALVDPSGESCINGNIISSTGMEPIGLEYIAACLQRARHNVRVIKQGSRTSRELLKMILSENPGLVGFSSMTYSAHSVSRICRAIKQADRKIVTVIGGYHATGYPRVIEDRSIDFAVMGEGETTLTELVECIGSRANPESVKGIAFRKGKELVVTPKRERIQDLDSLPWPLRPEGILSPDYREKVALTYSRGCPNACAYCCSRSIWGREVRWRSADDVADELKMIEERTSGNAHVFTTDLSITLNLRKLEELCEAIRRKEVRIQWQGEGSLNKNLNETTLSMMRDSGLRKFSFGIETFLPDTEIGRYADLEKARETFQLCNELGIGTRPFFMIGYPSQTERDFAYLSQWLHDIKPDFPRISFLTPFPGTPLYEECMRDGLLVTNDFRRYTSNEPVIRTNVSPVRMSQLRAKILEDYLNSPDYRDRIAKKLERFPELEYEFDYFFHEQGIEKLKNRP